MAPYYLFFMFIRDDLHKLYQISREGDAHNTSPTSEADWHSDEVFGIPTYQYRAVSSKQPTHPSPWRHTDPFRSGSTRGISAV